jgi:chromosome partitioning protein
LTRVIAICNQKGGVGKTTTSVNTAASLAALEKKVLIIDLDPQSNASQGLGFTKKLEKDVYSALIMTEDVVSKENIQSTIQKTDLDCLDIIPCSHDLAGFQVEIANKNQKERRFKMVLEKIKEEYEYVLIDSPPSLGLLTINILTAADTVLIPIQCEYYALAGLAELIKIIHLVQSNFNPSLRIEGALLTMFDSRLNLSKQVVSDVKQTFSNKVFETIIPRNVTLSEAPSFGKPIILYDIACLGSKKYLEFAEELIKNG